MRTMTGYVHGYGTPEQERLVEQAEHWRHRLIRDGTQLEPGRACSRSGAAWAPCWPFSDRSSPASPDRRRHRAEAARLRARAPRAGRSRGHLAAGRRARAPFEDESFDHVWMMWFLEHVADPPAVLREARRVLVPGGAITAIEVDYSTVRAEPSTTRSRRCSARWSRAMAASGWSDAGTRLPGWLREASVRSTRASENSGGRTTISPARRATRPT